MQIKNETTFKNGKAELCINETRYYVDSLWLNKNKPQEAKQEIANQLKLLDMLLEILDTETKNHQPSLH